MAPKYHPTPLSGADRKALSKELVKSRAMTGILAERSQEKRRVGEALIREADNLASQSRNEKIWSDGGPAQPSPTIGQGLPLKADIAQCSRHVSKVPMSRRRECKLHKGKADPKRLCLPQRSKVSAWQETASCILPCNPLAKPLRAIVSII